MSEAGLVHRLRVEVLTYRIRAHAHAAVVRHHAACEND